MKKIVLFVVAILIASGCFLFPKIKGYNSNSLFLSNIEALSQKEDDDFGLDVREKIVRTYAEFSGLMCASGWYDYKTWIEVQETSCEGIGKTKCFPDLDLTGKSGEEKYTCIHPNKH